MEKLITSPDEMPLYNWAKIVNFGKLDYMFTDFENKHDITDEVIQSYYNLFSETLEDKKIKSPIQLFHIFLIEHQKYRLAKTINSYTDLIEGEEIKEVSIQKVSNSFANYINSIDKKDGVYLISEYYFEDLPDCFEQLKDVSFFHILEYRMFCEKFEDRENYLNENFLNKHLKIREYKVVDVKQLQNAIFDEFKELNYYEFSYDVLKEIFHVNSLNFVSDNKETSTFELELQLIQKVTGNRLTLKENYLSEYIAGKQLAKMINEQNTKK